MKTWNGNIKLRCHPLSEGKIALSRIQIQESPVLLRGCPVDAANYGYDVLFEGRIVSPYLIDRVVELFEGHSIASIISLLMSESDHCFIWEFALLMDQLGMEKQLDQIREYIVKELRAPSESIRELFKLQNDFTPEQQATATSEEQVRTTTG